MSTTDMMPGDETKPLSDSIRLPSFSTGAVQWRDREIGSAWKRTNTRRGKTHRSRNSVGGAVQERHCGAGRGQWVGGWDLTTERAWDEDGGTGYEWDEEGVGSVKWEHCEYSQGQGWGQWGCAVDVDLEWTPCTETALPHDASIDHTFFNVY